MFVIKHLGLKNKGTVATQSITRGTRILTERPLFKLKTPGTINIDEAEHRIQEIQRKVQNISILKWHQFTQLHDARTDPNLGPPFSRFRTNALPIPSERGGIDGSIFLCASRINHSRVPNAAHSWNEQLDGGSLTLHAARDIVKEEEITISYPPVQTFANRRHTLKADFGFDCECLLCTANLYARMEDFEYVTRAPWHTMKDAHWLARMYKSCGFQTALSGAYKMAFTIAVADGDEARTNVFAKMALELQRCLRGEDDPGNAMIEGLVKESSKFEVPKRGESWKQRVENVLNASGERNWSGSSGKKVFIARSLECGIMIG